MTPTVRHLVAAALLVSLAGCGNKGPLVHPSPPATDVPAPTSPPSTDPTTVPPVDTSTPPDADPGGAVPPTPPPDSGGHG
ncbi:MAG: hypothetical protein JWL98_2174 [Xanthomonadaceae bacterium]|jgi:predicted small lipoprotein YifL|nr:hypothetical protein [Xanthomonadaceae bacterium]